MQLINSALNTKRFPIAYTQQKLQITTGKFSPKFPLPMLEFYIQIPFPLCEPFSRQCSPFREETGLTRELRATVEISDKKFKKLLAFTIVILKIYR